MKLNQKRYTPLHGFVLPILKYLFRVFSFKRELTLRETDLHVPLGTLLEMQSGSPPSPDLLNKNLHFKKSPRWLTSAFEFENGCSTLSGPKHCFVTVLYWPIARYHNQIWDRYDHIYGDNLCHEDCPLCK